MGIEALGSIGRAVSAAPSIGMKMGAIGVPLSVSRIINPDIGRMPSMWRGNKAPEKAMSPRAQMFAREFSPIRITRIATPKPQMRVADVIAQAEAIVKQAQRPSVLNKIAALPLLESRLDFLPRNDEWRQALVRTPEPAVVRFPYPAGGLDVRAITNPFPKVEAVPQSSVQRKTEGKPVTRSAKATSTPVTNQTHTEQMESKVIVEEKKKETGKAKKSEKESMVKIKIVEALKVTRLRKLAILEAVRKVKEEAEQKGEKVVITGKKIKRFLTADFWRYLSPLVGQEGYDGTIPLTLNALNNNQREYTNLEEAQTDLSKPVAEHIPLQMGEVGRVATIEEVREVLEGREKEVTRSQALAEVVIKRVAVKNETIAGIGQAVNTMVEEKEEVAGEPTLKSLGLEELFPKAA